MVTWPELCRWGFMLDSSTVLAIACDFGRYSLCGLWMRRELTIYFVRAVLYLMQADYQHINFFVVWQFSCPPSALPQFL